MAIDWCKLATFKAVFAGLDVLKVSPQSLQSLNVMCVVKVGDILSFFNRRLVPVGTLQAGDLGPAVVGLYILITGEKTGLLQG